MKRTASATFVLELPLVAAPADERQLLASFEASRRLYNAALGEALRRLDRMRQSRNWQKARMLPKTVGRKPNKERRAAFKHLEHAFGFTSAAVSAFGTKCKNEAGWSDRLGAHETQRIAERAFTAAQEHAFGHRGRPRFKGMRRPLHSIEAKTNAAGIRWKPSTETIEWGGLCLRALVPSKSKDRDGYVLEALSRRTKYCRIVWRLINGKRLWFVQLLQEGKPPRRYETAHGACVGVDIGPSTLAVVGDEAAALLPLAPSVVQPWHAVRRLQRKLDRSRRATNRHCFNTDGTWKRGARVKVRSHRYEKVRNDLAEQERILAERRRRDHGATCNRILAQGNVVQTEALSYKSFQGAYGRSVKVRAPGALIAQLRRKAESAGGTVVELDTRRLKLSQFDHATSSYTKKALSQRWHVLGDGSGVAQRDIYSAFLARHARAGQEAGHPPHAFGDIAEAWATAQPLLRRTGWLRNECANVESLLSTAQAAHGLPAPERIVRRRGLDQGHGGDAVAAMRELRDPLGNALRTPCL